MIDLKKNILLASALALAFASVSDLAAGLAWLGLILAGVGAWWSQRGQRPEAADLGPAWQAARLWWWASVLSWALMMLVTAYWGGPWPERHAQWRLLLGGLGLLCLVRYGRWSPMALRWLGHAAAATLCLAMLMTLWVGTDHTPSNRIPWMAGLSLLGLALLGWAHQAHLATLAVRRWWWLASLSTVLTALVSGVRGSWGLLLIWPLCAAILHRQGPAVWRWSWRRSLALVGGLSLVLVLSHPFLAPANRPVDRLVQMFSESGVLGAKAVDSNSSTGSRLLMYQAGLREVLENPSWLGLGHDEHIGRLKAHLRVYSPTYVEVIGHYHSDLLNPWVEFGLVGLAAYLITPLALFWIGLQLLRRQHASGAIGVWALSLTHLLTGLSNTNYAHNYYPVMLSLSMCMMVLGWSSTGNLESSVRDSQSIP